MRKILLLVFILFTILINAQIIYNLNDSVTKEASLTLSPALQYGFNNNYKIQLNIFDNNLLYTENKIFGRTIKIKKGFRYFDFFINLPINNNEFGMGYEQRKRDSLFGVLNTLSYERTEVYTGDYSKMNYNLYEFFIPSYIKGALFSVGNNSNSFIKLNFELQRWVKIPFRFSYSDDFNLSFKLVNFDKYNNEGMGIGLSYNGDFFPSVFTDFSLKILDQDLLIGLKADLKNQIGYEIYIVNKNLNIPVVFLMDENSGGIFVEF